MSKFTENKLELAFIELLGEQGINYQSGKDIQRDDSEVLLKDDLRAYLSKKYQSKNITDSEITTIVRKLESYPASDLYDTNKAIMNLVTSGFDFKREDATEVGRPSGLRKTTNPDNSLAHRTTWLRSDLILIKLS